MSRWFSVSVMLTLVALVGSLCLYQFARQHWPPEVPTHFDLSGVADAHTSRDSLFGLWLFAPLLMVGWLGLTLALPWLSPQSFEVDPFRATYEQLMALVNGFFFYIHGALLFCPLWAEGRTATFVIAGVFLLFALLGNLMGKVRRNFWIGVRTPWTLADVGVWNATHRHAAYVYTAAGLLGFGAVVLGVNLIVVFVVFMVAVLWPAVYSLLEYRRRAAAGLLAAESQPSA